MLKIVKLKKKEKKEKLKAIENLRRLVNEEYPNIKMNLTYETNLKEVKR